jgi:phosphoglycolate phosphatase
MPVTAILFDLDGTLVDSLPGIEYSIHAALREVLPDRESVEPRGWIGPPIRVMFRRAFQDIDDSTLNDLERAFRSSYDSEGWQKSVAYNDVAATLARLAGQGVRSFVVTNKPRIPTQRALGKFNLLQFFTAVVTPDSKSPPFASKSEMVAYSLTHYSLKPQHTVLVGDSDDDDRAAQDCGLSFLAVTYGYGTAHHAQRAEHVLSSLELLPERLAAFD